MGLRERISFPLFGGILLVGVLAYGLITQAFADGGQSGGNFVLCGSPDPTSTESPAPTSYTCEPVSGTNQLLCTPN